jgi:hypothetical protein
MGGHDMISLDRTFRWIHNHSRGGDDDHEDDDDEGDDDDDVDDDDHYHYSLFFILYCLKIFKSETSK